LATATIDVAHVHQAQRVEVDLAEVQHQKLVCHFFNKDRLATLVGCWFHLGGRLGLLPPLVVGS